jgi:hypothetical protein
MMQYFTIEIFQMVSKEVSEDETRHDTPSGRHSYNFQRFKVEAVWK